MTHAYTPVAVAKPGVAWHSWKVLAMLAIVVATAALAVWSATSDALVTKGSGHLPAWLFLALILFAVGFTLLAGWTTTGYWSGALIDPARGRMSLSRLQAILWTCLVIPAFLGAVMINLAQQNLAPSAVKDPLDVSIPGELLVLMGLTIGTAFASRLVLKQKDDSHGRADDATIASTTTPDPEPQAVYVAPVAQWRDLFRGDTVETRNLLDLGKLQLFYITGAVLIAYAVVLANAFVGHGASGVTSLPALNDTVIGLLAISHAGYLTYKAAQ